MADRLIEHRPEPDTAGLSDKDEFESLLAAYSVERQDDSAALTLAFSMATAAFTYMIAAAIFFSQQCNKDGCGSATVAQFVAPALPIAILSFLVLSTAATLLRSVELQTIEARLERLADNMAPANPAYVPRFHTKAGVVWRSAQFKNGPRIRHLFTTISTFAYIVVYGSLFGFTAYVLWLGGAWSTTKWIFAIVYGLIEVILVAGAFCAALWINASRHGRG